MDDNIFFWSVCHHLPNCTTSEPKTRYWTFTAAWTSKLLHSRRLSNTEPRVLHVRWHRGAYWPPQICLAVRGVDHSPLSATVLFMLKSTQGQQLLWVDQLKYVKTFPFTQWLEEWTCSNVPQAPWHKITYNIPAPNTRIWSKADEVRSGLDRGSLLLRLMYRAFFFGQANIYGPGVSRPSVWYFFITLILLADNYYDSRESSCFVMVEVCVSKCPWKHWIWWWVSKRAKMNS